MKTLLLFGELVRTLLLAGQFEFSLENRLRLARWLRLAIDVAQLGTIPFVSLLIFESLLTCELDLALALLLPLAVEDVSDLS